MKTAKLVFTNEAYEKTLALVDKFSTEVQWHGFITRRGNSCFVIEDIIVPPQIVGAATVDTDEVAYDSWEYTIPDDKFSKMRLHGHSHVNFGCSPSGVDRDYRKEKLTSFRGEKENAFYIFMIVNKRQNVECEIYDIRNRKAYSTRSNNIEFFIQKSSSHCENIENFITDAISKAKIEHKFKANTAVRTTEGNLWALT